jgi:hypothetical protein
MQDNFNIHSWKLKQAINELEQKQCPDCGCKMEGTMCNECGYMEEGATFTNKHDDNPELKGGQKKLPDELQAKILNKEAITPLADLYDLVEKLVAQGISKDEILRIVNFATANLNEGEDHEVSMAQNSLKAIVSSASQLMSKLGDDERNIPGWIQDHITNAENYIEQANQGFHELEPAVNNIDMDTMNMVAEEVSTDEKEKAKNALAIHLRSAMEDGNKEGIEQIKDARSKINSAKSVKELASILGEFGYKDNEISDILGK